MSRRARAPGHAAARGFSPVLVRSPRAFSRSGGRAAQAAGFTLIEVLVVIALIALIGTMTAVAMSGGLQGMRLRATSKDIASQLRFTRAQAIASGQPQRFVINPSGHLYAAPGKRNGRIPQELRIAFYGARQASAQAGEGAIVFYPDGASTGGSVELSAKQAARKITVAWLTGEVRLDTPGPAP
ncbi:MAG: GspH/FimT family pseudopilin [Pseudoxanthomonas sp.]|jgi:general secretion pathway protein H